MNTQQAIFQLKKSGLTQTSIASMIGCSSASISQVLHKKSGHINPSARVVNGLIKLLQERGLYDEKPEFL